MIEYSWEMIEICEKRVVVTFLVITCFETVGFLLWWISVFIILAHILSISNGRIFIELCGLVEVCLYDSKQYIPRV